MKAVIAMSMEVMYVPCLSFQVTLKIDRNNAWQLAMAFASVEYIGTSLCWIVGKWVLWGETGKILDAISYANTRILE